MNRGGGGGDRDTEGNKSLVVESSLTYFGSLWPLGRTFDESGVQSYEEHCFKVPSSRDTLGVFSTSSVSRTVFPVSSLSESRTCVSGPVSESVLRHRNCLVLLSSLQWSGEGSGGTDGGASEDPDPICTETGVPEPET